MYMYMFIYIIRDTYRYVLCIHTFILLTCTDILNGHIRAWHDAGYMYKGYGGFLECGGYLKSSKIFQNSPFD